MFGGSANDLLTDDSLWQWNGRAWRAIARGGPGGRSLAAATYDSRRKVLVLYGGADSASGTRYGDTWEWNGQRWLQRVVRTPGPRDHHAMAYDEARGVAVMYGGFDYQRGTDQLKETWTWDGETWRMADKATGPGALAHHAMAYDARRQRVVMFGFVREPPGSSDASRQPVPQTFEWDGTRWERAKVDGQEPDVGAPHRLVYDAARGVTVLIGGQSSERATWSWDGLRWTRAETSNPGIGVYPAVAYEMRSQRIIAWGGSLPYLRDRPRNQQPPASAWPPGVWEWDGQQWREAAKRP